MNFKEIAGWILLLIGLSIVGWGLYYSYNIFSAKTPVPMVF